MARVNLAKVKEIAEVVKRLPGGTGGLNFYSFVAGGKEVIASDMYPPLDHPAAIDFFFFACMHQYGFWHGNEKGYAEPLFGTFYGKRAKGSDIIWKAMKRALDRDPRIFSPKYLSQLAVVQKLPEIFSDDNGPVLFPDWETRMKLTKKYAFWFFSQQITPAQLVEEANKSHEPLRTFRDLLKKIWGYDQDPLEKKSLLLAMALAHRPEKFLHATDTWHWSPIIDYHLMRLSLRLGMVELEEREREPNEQRHWVDAETERAIRTAVFEAVSLLIALSCRTMSFIDQIMWEARAYCPEILDPKCQMCMFEKPCAQETKLFQPVFRTAAY